MTPMKDSETLVAELRKWKSRTRVGDQPDWRNLLIQAADHIEALSRAPAKGEREQIARIADVLLNAGCGDSDECERIARQALNHEEQSDV